MNDYTARLLRELAIFECYHPHIFARCIRARRKDLAMQGITYPEQEIIYIKTQQHTTFH